MPEIGKLPGKLPEAGGGSRQVKKLLPAQLARLWFPQVAIQWGLTLTVSPAGLSLVSKAGASTSKAK